MTHLAAGTRLSLAVEVQMRLGIGQDRAPAVRLVADQIVHRHPRSASLVLPSGNPHMARIWFSNWLVMAPSIVQCPLLWTRGAISLNTGPSSVAKYSIASVPT